MSFLILVILPAFRRVSVFSLARENVTFRFDLPRRLTETPRGFCRAEATGMMKS